MPFIAIALFVALTVGGGVSVAANQAQPGDALYSFKTHVNDNVRAGVEATHKEFAHIGASIKSTLNFDADVHEDTETDRHDPRKTDATDDTSTSADASAEVKGKIKAEDAYNADGSLKSDLDTKVHINF